MQHEGIIMVWIVVRLISDLNHPLRLLMGEVYHVEFAEIAETECQIAVAKCFLANRNVLSSSVSHSFLSPENRELKTARYLLMDLRSAGIRIS